MSSHKSEPPVYEFRTAWQAVIFFFCGLYTLHALTAEEINSADDEISQIRSILIENSPYTKDQIEKALDIADRMLVIDTHVDAPIKQYYEQRDLTHWRDDVEFDLPRAIAGGWNSVFMSIYTSASAAETGESKEIADFEIDFVEDLVASAPAMAAIATCTSDILILREQGKLALPLGMENASALHGDLTTLPYWYDRGIRYITLAHSKSNEFSDSSYDENEPWQGLSPTGIELVQRMNEMGILIDISHLTDLASWQVLEKSNTPVVATHSSLRHFIPGFHRNMPDDMVAAMAENQGVVMINFGSAFVSAESRQWSDQYSEATSAAMGEEEWEREQRQEFRAKYLEENPFPFATVATVADHFDRVVELAGIDYVGLGSDYDGVGDTLPEGLKDISQLPNLIAELLDRGYSENDLEKLLGLNFMRVWHENEQYAKSFGNEAKCSH